MFNSLSDQFVLLAPCLTPPARSICPQFDQFARSKLALDGGSTFHLVTDGQLHLRQCLHPEACSKSMELPHYYWAFHDLRKQFRETYKTEEMNSVQDMLTCILFGALLMMGRWKGRGDDVAGWEGKFTGVFKCLHLFSTAFGGGQLAA